MQVIGIDPHKGSHAAVAIGTDEKVIASVRFESSRRQVDRLVAFAASWPERVWAVEGAAGVGRLLARQLVARGERVLDVPPSLSTRVRVLSGRSGRKPDAQDARAVAIAALHNPNLVGVSLEDVSRGLRLLPDRRGQLVASPTPDDHPAAQPARGARRRRRTAVTYGGEAAVILRRIRPATDVDVIRKELARDLLDDVKRLDAELAAN